MLFQRTLQFRIVVASALLSALIVVVVSVYVVQDARDRAIGVLEDSATEQAAFIVDSFPGRLSGAPIADIASGASGARVTILDADGFVIDDSHAGIGERPGLRNSPEIAAALSTGESLRHGSDPVLGGRSVIVARVVESDGLTTAIVRVALPISEADDSILGLRTTAIVGGILTVAVATVFATFLSARLTRSIATVTEGARRVAAGDLGHRLRPEPPLEVERLAGAVNEMAGRLSELISLEAQERSRIESILLSMSDGVVVIDAAGIVELANPAAMAILGGTSDEAAGRPLYSINRNYELNQLATEAAQKRDATQGEIEFLDSRRFVRVLAVPLPAEQNGDSANRALVLLTDLTDSQRVERTRREFVSNASHELRTPLTAIRASVETLSDGAIEDPDAAKEFLDRMSADTARMDALITEMLELSRLETGETELNLSELSPDDLMRQALDLMKPQADLAGVRLAATDESEGTRFRGDQRRLVEALTNLISNAIKASPDGPEVSVSASLDEGFVTFNVEDQGSGIEPEHAPHIFERFYKADPSRSDGGAGLGLAIVKHIAVAHGGDVTVQSEPGAGATFVLKLPRN